MRVLHPRARDDRAGRPPPKVYVGGERVQLAPDGTFATDDEDWVRQFADAHDVRLGQILVEGGPATCQAVQRDGEVCGRELPCQYHADDGVA